jgi:hypothetical protein
MANWMTAVEISARYIVGEQKLLAFAARGNMPMLRGEDGIIRFDAHHAAMLFRPRDPAAALPIAVDTSGKPNLGILGVTRLGEARLGEARLGEQAAPKPAPASPSMRQAHRRARRAAERELAARKVG